MERPKARPRNFFNTERPDRDNERDKNDNETPEKRPRRDRDRDRTRSAAGPRESTVENDSDLDTAELNRKIERLQRDLTRRDRELEDERLENEKIMDKIKKLERDKVELKREVEDFRLEAEEYKRTLDDYKAQMRSRGGSYSPAGSDSGHIHSDQNGNTSAGEHHGSSKNYELVLNQKNKEISQLIDDVEKLEEEKANVQEKLSQLKDNLDDATKLIETMAGEHFNLKSKLENAEDQIRLLEEEKTVLQIKERDLMGFKERHEQYLDNLCKAVDIRVDIWKKMMLEKDEEINRLNSKIDTLMSQIPNMQLDSEQSTIRHLQSKLSEREDQISQLNDELSRATDELNSNIKVIEKLQSRLDATEDAEKTEKMVKSLQARIKKLEDKVAKKEHQLKVVEREAEAESSEHAALLARIHAYETGEYGLAEAISEIKDLKNQIRIRDKQVESVTQEINILQMHVQDLEDENEMLRDKLGLEKHVDVSRETKRYLKNRKNEIIALRSKVGHLEDTIVQLKTMNYSLRKQITQLELNQSERMDGMAPERDRPDSVRESSPRPTPATTNLAGNSMGMTVNFKPEDWKQKYEIILEENTALRKGLQEILDAMHKLTDEGTSDVIIQSPVLEDLLREMSARGIINYPYPVTSFHLKVCNLEGKCAQLREDLHRVRQDEKECRAELMEAKSMLMLYEEKLRQLESLPALIEDPTKEVESKEIQTDTQVTEANSPDVEGRISEQDVTERINREKEKLGEMMEDLKLRILELEESRRSRDDVTVSELFGARRGEEVPSQIDISDTLTATRDTINILEERFARTGQLISGTQTEISFLDKVDIDSQTEGVQMEIEEPVKDNAHNKETADRDAFTEIIRKLKERIEELENNLKAKDELIHGFKIIRPTHPDDDHSSTFSELQEALEVARETTDSLHERLKSKDESIVQYRKLLAEVRKEMTNASERHVQEMRQMQMTIHQQQQAFTRMKSTLSQPVKDTMSIEGTIKDQLTRIHELEDEVSQLQHTLANVASQLTAARSDAHRWRCTAEMRLKEVEQARDHFSAETAEEVQNLRRKLKEAQIKLERAEDQLDNNKSVQHRDSLSDLVSILRKELEEKDKQIGMYLKTLKSTTFNEKSHYESVLNTKEREIEAFKEEIMKHQKTISNLQLRLSKTKAINFKAGVTAELEELRIKYRDLQDEKTKLEKDMQEIHSKRDEEEAKKIKTTDSIARWEESKKWKKSKERLESRVKELEHENEKLEKFVQTLKAAVHRLEKEKMILDSKLKSRLSLHGSSLSKSSLENISEGSAPSGSYHQSYILAQGEIARLQMELQDTKELMEKTEFEGREEIEKLKMEVRCLKERIVTQERQLTAYEVAQKGDPQVVQEIQKMAALESEFQKEVIRLEQENMHLRLQIEQLQLETPRLRDRVQHLQKIVDALKAEKPLSGHKYGSIKSTKPLGELERTITALKQVIEKLQTENKKLKTRDLGGTNPRTVASERLRTSVNALMEEKRALLDKVQSLEQETEKYQRLYMEKSSVVDSYESRLQDAEKRAKSTEMKLKALLDGQKTAPDTVPSAPNPPLGSNYNELTHKVKKLEVELMHKTQVLSTAKQALKDAERMAAEWVESSSTRASSSKSQGNVRV